MADSYKTIANQCTSLLKAKSSKFFAYSFKVRSREEVKSMIEHLKKEHHSARHWCYAYRLGEEGEDYRSNDDGEPSHSAGDPILRQIESLDLTMTLVVVVRYFGGIKLGVGGLIQAYGGAAAEALELSGIREILVQDQWRIKFDYEDMSIVMRTLKKYGAHMLEQDFRDTCELLVQIDRERSQAFKEALDQLHRVTCANPQDE